jgi:surfactin synthase thioesterase subunit
MTAQSKKQDSSHVQVSPYLTTVPDPQAGLRLFCFHEGGATAASFARWAELFPSEVSVIPIQLPGHGNRSRESCITDRDLLLQEVNEHLGPELDAPYALYGQCMGALLAYSFTRLRIHNGESLPRCLLVGSCAAPPATSWMEQYADTDENLLKSLVRVGTLSPEVLSRPEWLAPALALARSDVSVVLDPPTESEPVPCPLHSFVGKDDFSLTAQDGEKWAALTTSEFSTDTVPGGHVFTINPSEIFITLATNLLHKYILATH